jgi:hypothetical protein
MTDPDHGKPFHLFPPIHWQELAQATRANIQNLQKARDNKIAALHKTHAHLAEHERKVIIDQIHTEYKDQEKNATSSYNWQIKWWQKYVKLHPEHKDFRWDRSDPPTSLDKNRIHPAFVESPHHEPMRQKLRNVRKIQHFQGRKITLHTDT